MEPNFYEVLEVPQDANDQRIERAYRIARATYQPASPATYSVFDDADNADIMQRIEEAYAVLSDPRLRREYDARLRRAVDPQPRPRNVLPPAPDPAAAEPPAAPELPAAPEPVVVPASVDPRPWRTSETAVPDPPAPAADPASEAGLAEEPVAGVRIEGESRPVVGAGAEWQEDDEDYEAELLAAAGQPEPSIAPADLLDEPEPEPEPAALEPESGSVQEAEAEPDPDADEAPAPPPLAAEAELDVTESEPEVEAEPEAAPEPDALEELAGLDDGVFDGRALRNARQNLGIDLDEIAAATKINERILRLIEANHYAELPAPVYLRGFLRQFAKALRLDPVLVVDSYMKQAEETRGRR